VIASLFFILMLLDSFFEGRSPTSSVLGVPRLNTRLAFYAYERRKLTTLRLQGRLSSVGRGSATLRVSAESSLFSYLVDGGTDLVAPSQARRGAWPRRSF
jgi:hypothetical protein